MSAPRSIKELLSEVLRRIKPTNEDEKVINEFSNGLVNEVYNVLGDKLNYEFKVSVEGSVAKNTWLKGDVDLDIFVLIKYRELSRSWLEENFINPLIQGLSDKYRVILRYAQHPYVTACMGDLCADIVPAYWASNPSEVITAVDRTPFHTEYIKRNLRKNQLDEVRLLKAFFKGVGIYGAELKVKGFSGYLTELLIVRYGDFLSAVDGIAKWRPPVLIDLEGHCINVNECLKKFKEYPLIVIDPVDPKRNAAAAVGMRSLALAILACRAFLIKPSLKFFFPDINIYSLGKILKALEKRGSSLTGLIVYTHEVAPENVWGHLRSIEEKLVNGLTKGGFNIIYSDIWFNEKDLAIILFEYIPKELPRVKIMEGPPVFLERHSDRFITKHGFSEVFDVGVWISKDGRLLTLGEVKFRKAHELLRQLLKQVKIHKGIVKDMVIIDDLDSLRNLYVELGVDFRKWLTQFVVKTPTWLVN
ncbi:MAG TPA: CCA tRNA nucleotidyltransferase [Acidilobales archaeon]|nr:CCA tRNA nucleotidyltransferase [Acidilobales archaeon]